MSFGTSVGDVIVIVQLAWNTFQGAKKACGEHNELTSEVRSLYKVLRRVQREISEAPACAENDERRNELDEHIAGCENILRVIYAVLKEYNALGDDKKKGKRLWQKIKFGNGEMRNLADIRLKLSTHTAAIGMSLKLYILGGLGRVETQLKNQEGDLKGIREAINWIIADTTACKSVKGEGSVWTTYENDNMQFWRDLRRQLLKEGFSRNTLQMKQGLVRAYVEELGNKRVLDEDESDGDEPLELDMEKPALGSRSCSLNDNVESQTEDPESTEVESSLDGEDIQISYANYPVGENAAHSTPHTIRSLRPNTKSSEDKNVEVSLYSLSMDDHISSGPAQPESDEDEPESQVVSESPANRVPQQVLSSRGSNYLPVSIEEILDKHLAEDSDPTIEASSSSARTLDTSILESSRRSLKNGNACKIEQPKVKAKEHASLSEYDRDHGLTSLSFENWAYL